MKTNESIKWWINLSPLQQEKICESFGYENLHLDLITKEQIQILFEFINKGDVEIIEELFSYLEENPQRRNLGTQRSPFGIGS
jgi:hypothetical protein